MQQSVLTALLIANLFYLDLCFGSLPALLLESHERNCELYEVLTVDALGIIREYNKVQHILQRFGDRIDHDT